MQVTNENDLHSPQQSHQKIPVSVQICTLNEEKNILSCLEKIIENNPEEIIVIDGGSIDETVQRALSFGVKIIRAGRVGLARQRQMGIESTHLPYIAIIDADDRIEPNFLKTLLSQMNAGNYQVIQANVQPFNSHGYWQKGWGLFCSLSNNTVGKTTMVGRPALFSRDSIVKVGFDPFFTYGSEDTDISYRFEKLHYSQAIGTGISFRIFPHTFEECRGKWIGYGKGYARFAFKHPERRANMLKHLLWNIPIKRNITAVKNSFFIYSPFFFTYAFFCFLGFVLETNALRKNSSPS